jgi:hypothetical protein
LFGWYFHLKITFILYNNKKGELYEENYKKYQK